MKAKLSRILVLVLTIFFIYSYYQAGRKATRQDILTIFGNVDIRQAELGFRVFGKVKRLYVDEGDEVVPGTLLAELDPGPYRSEYRQAKAHVSTVKAQVENAELKFLRREDIDSLALSEEEYEDALFATEELYANLDEAKASLALAKIHLFDTRLFAPSEGTILTRIREKGSVLNAGDPVFTLALRSPVWVRAYVSERNLGKIYPGMKAKITTDAAPDAEINGSVGFISPTAEFTPKTVETLELRTDLVYRLRIIVSHPPKTLRQGMPVTVHLIEEKGA